MSILGKDRETTPNCRAIAPPTPPPSCSTFSPGCSVGGWMGEMRRRCYQQTLPVGASPLSLSIKCRLTSPLWSQPVRGGASHAAAHSLSLWRKWTLQELDQTPNSSFSFRWRCRILPRRPDDSRLVSFSGCLRSSGATVGLRWQQVTLFPFLSVSIIT